jgi:hypothetical protein
MSKLSVWWLRLGIAIERIKPGHPQQNGLHVSGMDNEKNGAPDRKRFKTLKSLQNQIAVSHPLAICVPLE